jgi:NADPH-dependent glutamate synthase beta subunit-like oxidoreductase
VQDNGRPVIKPIAGSEFELECELVLLALGFLGPEADTIVAQLGCELTERGNLKAGPDYQTTVPGRVRLRPRAARPVAGGVGDLGGPGGDARRGCLPDGRDGAAGQPGAVGERSFLGTRRRITAEVARHG